MPARRWLVAGIVQGVGFRWFVARRAERLGLDGHARNLPDGRVEVVAAGPEGMLAELEAALRAGPRAARVDAVEATEVPLESVVRKGFHTA